MSRHCVAAAISPCRPSQLSAGGTTLDGRHVFSVILTRGLRRLASTHRESDTAWLNRVNSSGASWAKCSSSSLDVTSPLVSLLPAHPREVNQAWAQCVKQHIQARVSPFFAVSTKVTFLEDVLCQGFAGVTTPLRSHVWLELLSYSTIFFTGPLRQQWSTLTHSIIPRVLSREVALEQLMDPARALSARSIDDRSVLDMLGEKPCVTQSCLQPVERRCFQERIEAFEQVVMNALRALFFLESVSSLPQFVSRRTESIEDVMDDWFAATVEPHLNNWDSLSKCVEDESVLSQLQNLRHAKVDNGEVDATKWFTHHNAARRRTLLCTLVGMFDERKHRFTSSLSIAGGGSGVPLSMCREQVDSWLYDFLMAVS